MITREQYLGNVIFSDPTAERAIGNVHRSSRSHPVDKQIQPDLTTHITALNSELRGLNERRRLKEITRGEYAELRAPLVITYHALLQAHLARREGEKNDY